MANVYYIRERPAEPAALTMGTEFAPGGPRRERLVYALTDQGRQRFHELLRAVVGTYEVAHTGVEVGMVFLPYLDSQDAVHLLEERRQAVLVRRTLIDRDAGPTGHRHIE